MILLLRAPICCFRDWIFFSIPQSTILIIFILSSFSLIPVLAAAPDIITLYVLLNNLSPHYIKYYTIPFLLIPLFFIVSYLLTTGYPLMCSFYTLLWRALMFFHTRYLINNYRSVFYVSLNYLSSLQLQTSYIHFPAFPRKIPFKTLGTSPLPVLKRISLLF